VQPARAGVGVAEPGARAGAAATGAHRAAALPARIRLRRVLRRTPYVTYRSTPHFPCSLTSSSTWAELNGMVRLICQWAPSLQWLRSSSGRCRSSRGSSRTRSSTRPGPSAPSTGYAYVQIRSPSFSQVLAFIYFTDRSSSFFLANFHGAGFS
jgi:hypothetical protein